MRPDDGGIDDQIFEVRIIGHRLEDPPPNTLDAPSTEAPEYAVPVSERLRKITPGRARTSIAHLSRTSGCPARSSPSGRAGLCSAAPFAPRPRRSTPNDPSHPRPPP